MRRGAIAAIVVTVVVLAGAGGIWWISTRPPSAEDGARRYLAALASGDAAAVVALQEPALGSDEQGQLMDAFAGATEYPSDGRVVEVAHDDSVRATVVLGGQRRQLEFGMTLDGNTWRITSDHLAALTVTTILGDSVWIGDALLPVGGAISLLPAVYPVTPAPRNVLTGATTVVVTGEEPLTVAVEASVSPDATTLVTEQLREYEDSCSRTSEAVPRHCGLRVPWAADLTSLSSIAWRIDQRPTVTLSPDGRSFAATGGVIVATATGTTPAGAPASFTYRADDWALRGSVVLSGDTMTLAVD